MVNFTCWIGLLLWAVLVTTRSLPTSSETATHQNIERQLDRTLIKRIRRNNARDSIILHPLTGPGLPYFDDIAFKSPCDQPVQRIAVDTGSSDFWIDSRFWCSCLAVDKYREAREICGRVKAAQQSSAQWLEYDDGLSAYGSFVTEDLWFGNNNAILKQTTFMAASDFRTEGDHQEQSAISGLVGLGYIRNQQSQNPKYKTLPHVLEQNGNTTSNAFSMWFINRELDGDMIGQILFGGYVTNYYQGTLSTFPIVEEQYLGKPTEVAIQLDRIIFDKQGIFSSCAYRLPVLLDTGSYSSWLPVDIFERLVNNMGSNSLYEDDKRQFAVFENCDLLTLNKPVQFQFGNIVISVPISDIIRPVTQAEVAADRFPGLARTKQCVTHGIAAYTSTYLRTARERSQRIPYILGATFLRHAFILYDLSQGQVALAQADQTAIQNVAPNIFSFQDSYTHQGQGPYNPTRGTSQICPLT